MLFAKSLLLALPTLTLAAAPLPIDKRQSSTSCGGTSYSSGEVRNAANTACNYVSSDREAGGSTYPHQYNNYEGFDFPVGGPYYEFPILDGGYTYGGGSPGADRVIINANCAYAGAITHTGASGNNFVGCSGTS